MKKGLQEKICAIFQRTVQLTLHIFSTLCASFRKSTTTKKCLGENGKIDKNLNYFIKKHPNKKDRLRELTD